MAGGNSGGGNSSSGKSGGGDIIQGATVNVHPRGLLEALGFIEQAYADELGGAEIDSRRLTTPVRWEFMEVGFRSSLVSGLTTALLSPLAIGVLEKSVPIFGSTQPSLFDQFCGLLLAMVFALGYSLFLAGVATKHLGGYSRAMVSNLLGGVAIFGVIKALVVFIVFHMIYFYVLTDKNIISTLKFLYNFKLPYDAAASIFLWVRHFKPVFITSAYFVVLTTAIFIFIPYAAMLWAHLRNKKLIDAGVVNVYKESN